MLGPSLRMRKKLEYPPGAQARLSLHLSKCHIVGNLIIITVEIGDISAWKNNPTLL